MPGVREKLAPALEAGGGALSPASAVWAWATSVAASFKLGGSNLATRRHTLTLKLKHLRYTLPQTKRSSVVHSEA